MRETINNQQQDEPLHLTKKTKNTFDSQYGKVLPAILIGWYYFNSLQPPYGEFIELRWYLALGLAGMAFIIQRRYLGSENAIIFVFVQGMALTGASLSLVRATDFDNALTNTISMAIGFITILLMITTLSTQMGRTISLIVVVVVASMWVIEIQYRLAAFGFFEPSSFSSAEDNKNAVSLILAMGSTVLLAFSFFVQFSQKKNNKQYLFLRMIVVVVSLFMVYNLSLTYSRSELLNAFFGIMIVLSMYFYMSQNRGAKVGAKILLFIVFLGIVVYATVPRILVVSPHWERMLQPFLNFDDPMVLIARRSLLEKGFLIIADNPFFGIGAGNTKAIYDSFEIITMRGLIHNTYLTYWAEYGLFGFFSLVAFILIYWKILREKFTSMQLVDQIWMTLFPLFYFALSFKNLSIIFMLAVLTGLYNQYYQGSETKSFFNPREK